MTVCPVGDALDQRLHHLCRNTHDSPFHPEFCHVTDQLMTRSQRDLPACGIHQVSSQRTPVAYCREWGAMSPRVFLIRRASCRPLSVRTYNSDRSLLACGCFSFSPPAKRLSVVTLLSYMWVATELGRNRNVNIYKHFCNMWSSPHCPPRAPPAIPRRPTWGTRPTVW